MVLNFQNVKIVTLMEWPNFQFGCLISTQTDQIEMIHLFVSYTTILIVIALPFKIERQPTLKY